mmetsp:Transcript_29769/g.43879  ORF Transcript_29769/g.43879 Transcript_29769/m.43879 type:complete len:81 (-) Transcript_29769:1289-1531(-)
MIHKATLRRLTVVGHSSGGATEFSQTAAAARSSGLPPLLLQMGRQVSMHPPGQFEAAAEEETDGKAEAYHTASTLVSSSL